MLMLAIKWLLPLVAIGFLAGVIFRMRSQIALAIALALGSVFYFFSYKYGQDPNFSALYFLISIPLFAASYGGGALFGKFVQSEVKGKPLMMTVSVLTVGLFLLATTNSAVYR